jgi:hypothetical protein
VIFYGKFMIMSVGGDVRLKRERVWTLQGYVTGGRGLGGKNTN